MKCFHSLPTLLLSLFCVAQACADSAIKPNILMILVDDLKPALDVMGILSLALLTWIAWLPVACVLKWRIAISRCVLLPEII